MGTKTPKQLLELAGEPVLSYSIGLFASLGFVDHIVAVMADPSALPGLEGYAADTPLSVTKGGPSRMASVGEGLVCLPEATRVVFVHDAARPLVTKALAERLYAALDDEVDGVVPVLPEGDALKEVSSKGMVLASRSKAGLFRVQTPQVFEKESLQDALARSMAEGHEPEDCSEMLLRSGYRVRAVEGDRLNIKITYKEDLMICEQILASRRSS